MLLLSEWRHEWRQIASYFIGAFVPFVRAMREEGRTEGIVRIGMHSLKLPGC